MRTVVFAGNSKIDVRDLTTPTPGPGEVLLKVEASAICGSEMSTFRSAEGHPTNPGHELVGTVVANPGESDHRLAIASPRTSSPAAGSASIAVPGIAASATIKAMCGRHTPSTRRCRPSVACHCPMTFPSMKACSWEETRWAWRTTRWQRPGCSLRRRLPWLAADQSAWLHFVAWFQGGADYRGRGQPLPARHRRTGRSGGSHRSHGN